jgi:hypothetical protein
MPSEHVFPSPFSTFYHFLPPLLTHILGSQAIPPFFAYAAMKNHPAACSPVPEKVSLQNNPAVPEGKTMRRHSYKCLNFIKKTKQSLRTRVPDKIFSLFPQCLDSQF